MGNEYLGLSLFIMLLSFFIVLNALSDYEETKSAPVLSSISMAFSSNPVGTKDNQSIQQTEVSKDTGKGDTLDQIEGVFAAHLEGFKVQENRLGTEMFVFIPVDEFERLLAKIAGTLPQARQQEDAPKTTGLYDGPLEDTPDFMPMLISLMKSEDSGVPYRADMVLKQPVSEQNPRTAMVEKVTSWAQIIENAGLPQKYLSAGIEAVSPQNAGVYLHFRRYEPVILSAATFVSGDKLELTGDGGEEE